MGPEQGAIRREWQALYKDGKASAPAHAPDLRPCRPRSTGPIGTLPAGEPGSGHPLRYASWKGPAIPCEASLAVNRFLTR